MALLDELAVYLAAQGVANIQRGALMDTPDACVALIETGGLGSVHTMSGGAGSAKVERPGLQVLVRGAAQDYEEPRSRATSVYTALDGLANTDLSGVRYFSIFAEQSPFLVGRDDNARVLIGFNLLVEKVPS